MDFRYKTLVAAILAVIAPQAEPYFAVLLHDPDGDTSDDGIVLIETHDIVFPTGVSGGTRFNAWRNDLEVEFPDESPQGRNFRGWESLAESQFHFEPP